MMQPEDEKVAPAQEGLTDQDQKAVVPDDVGVVFCAAVQAKPPAE